MARKVTPAANYLSNGAAAPDFPTTGTFAIWCLPSQRIPDGTARMLCHLTKAGGYEFAIWIWSDGRIYIGFYPGGESRIVTTSGSTYLSGGAWHLFVYE